MSEQELQEEQSLRRLNIPLWRRILSHARPYRSRLVALMVSGFIFAWIDVFLPRITGLVIDEATTNGITGTLGMRVIEYFGLVVGMAFLIWFFIVMAGQAATGFAYTMRNAAFSHLQRLSFSFYDKRTVGWLMARLTSDCERVSSIIPWFMLDIVWGTTLIIGTSIMMLRLNTQLGMLIIMILPPLAVISVLYQRKLLETQRLVRKANSHLTAWFNEAIMGVRTTKALVREEENLDEFREHSGSMYSHSVRNALFAAAYLPIIISMGSMGVGLVLWRGGITLGESLSFGVLVSFMQYAAFFYIPIQELAERFTQLQAAQASAERVQEIVDTIPEIRDTADVTIESRYLFGDPGQHDRIRRVEFDNVSFGYKPGMPVIRSFSLRVHAGETVALVGPTGCGKTTIISLLCRFYEPAEGVIRINGIDYRNIPLSRLQSKLGIVLQTPHLFSGTVRENIRYGRLDARNEAVMEAARLVNAHAFIKDLENGYDTEVGEGGGRLSTGQRQLISLARAVIANPEIFIMDEATSSVDTETERLIQEGIRTVMEGRISFMIAHRLSTIRSAGNIIVMDKGSILESGTHSELMQLRGRYYDLYTKQFERETEEHLLQETVVS